MNEGDEDDRLKGLDSAARFFSRMHHPRGTDALWWCAGVASFAFLGLLVVVARSAGENERRVNAAEAIKQASVDALALERARKEELAEREEVAQKKRDTEAENARYLANAAAMSPQDREGEVRRCVTVTCNTETSNALIASAKTPKEKARLELVREAASIERIARSAHDGETQSINAIAAIAVILQNTGVAPLGAIEKTRIGAATKDPDEARGHLLRAAGNIIEIKRDGTVFVGALATEDSHILRVVTPFPTPGIEQGTWASFRGVFIQEYDYANVSGGQTRSLLAVGTFEQ